MADAGVTRFVGISGAGMDAPDDHESRGGRSMSWLIQRLGRTIVADKLAELKALTDSNLTWTLTGLPSWCQRSSMER